jgi:hypothetical protein
VEENLQNRNILSQLKVTKSLVHIKKKLLVYL